MNLALTILAGVYLLIGFIYAIFVVLNRGGGVFSIPLNTLLGPIWAPYMYLDTIRLMKKKRTITKKEMQELGIEEQYIDPIFESSEEEK